MSVVTTFNYVCVFCQALIKTLVSYVLTNIVTFQCY